MEQVHRTRALIVGSGGNGMSAAIRLREAGVTDVLIITKHDEFGGTWYQNTYPGCAVDVPSYLYQLGCAPSSDWTHTHASQPELLAYLKGVACEHGLYDLVRFKTEMLEAQWLSDELCWSVTTNGPTYKADILILATGFLEEPLWPVIPGMDRFQGRIFHSSQWPDGYTGEGDRVAVVGTGSSSLQIVPAMEQVASEVIVFQRTPNHIVPKGARDIPPQERAELQANPERFAELVDKARETMELGWNGAVLGRDQRLANERENGALGYLAQQIADPQLRAALTPPHPISCKRVGLSDDYYAALTSDHVQLVAEAAAEIGPSSITSASGRTFEVDTIVLATGFRWGTHILSKIRRRDGRTVADVQQGRPRAYKAMSVAGCPNFFLVGGAGPNGQVWNGFVSGDLTAGYVLRALRYMEANGIRALEVEEDAELEWKRDADELLDNTSTVAGGCTNYSLDESGHNQAAYPGTLAEMEAAFGAFDASAYRAVTADDDRIAVSVGD